MGELMGKGRLNPDGNMGFAAILSFSSSASCSLLALALRFWNQILTWVSVRLRELENSALSAMDRYCFWRNLRSRASSWEVVNGVLSLLPPYSSCASSGCRQWGSDVLQGRERPVITKAGRLGCSGEMLCLIGLRLGGRGM